MWEPIINIREYKDQVGQMTNNYKGGKNKVFSNSARGILKIIIKKSLNQAITLKDFMLDIMFPLVLERK